MFKEILQVIHEVEAKDERISFVGNLDTYGLQVKKDEILQIINSITKDIVVFDFEKLNYINSESISFILQVKDLLTKNNKQFVIVSARKIVLDVLSVIGILGKEVKYFDTLDEFYKSIA